MLLFLYPVVREVEGYPELSLWELVIQDRIPFLIGNLFGSRSMRFGIHIMTVDDSLALTGSGSIGRRSEATIIFEEKAGETNYMSITLMIYGHHVFSGNSPEVRSYRNYRQIYHGPGWYIVKIPDLVFIAHGGGGPGFASNMRLYPDREFGMVVIANGTYLPKREFNDLLASLDW